MQIKLSWFAILLFVLALLLAIIVFSANRWELHNEVVLYGICVAVAVIPESLIAVVTITMLVGANVMFKRNVLVRRTASLEAIGGVTNICSDKTGTLTQGKMVANKVWIPEMGTLIVKNTTHNLDPEDGGLDIGDKALDFASVATDPGFNILRPLLDAIALCNNATVFKRSGTEVSTDTAVVTEVWDARGDPTEAALQVLAMRFTREYEFNLNLKRMSVAYKRQRSRDIQVFVKGAAEAILPILDTPGTGCIQTIVKQLADDGLRVICVATKIVPEEKEIHLADRASMEVGLEFQELIGLHDPPRLENMVQFRDIQRLFRDSEMP